MTNEQLEHEGRALRDLAASISKNACADGGAALIVKMLPLEAGGEGRALTGWAREVHRLEGVNALVFAKMIVFLERQVTMHAARSKDPTAFMKVFADTLIRARSGEALVDLSQDPT